MSETAAQLLSTLLALPPEDRELIAHRLLESLGDGPDVEEDAAFLATLNRRIEEIETGKVQGVPAEEVFRRLREKYP